jgi:hypothetical protein
MQLFLLRQIFPELLAIFESGVAGGTMTLNAYMQAFACS